MTKDRTKCTVIYEGREADMDDEKAVQELLTPMFQSIHRGELPMRSKYLFPELEATAIELAILVGRLEAVEDEKKEANADFKERIDLLKFQIKQAAKTINEGVAGLYVTGEKKDAGDGPGNLKYAPVPEGEAAH